MPILLNNTDTWLFYSPIKSAAVVLSEAKWCLFNKQFFKRDLTCREESLQGKEKRLRGTLGEEISPWARNHSPQQLLARLEAFGERLDHLLPLGLGCALLCP